MFLVLNKEILVCLKRIEVLIYIYLKNVLVACFDIFLDSAPFMMIGFLIAGLLKAFVPENLVSRHLKGKGIMPVLKASALGVPIPLCSCGVIPAAAGLNEKGADKGAVAAFMISTPETGVDSISVSWALLDPFMTIIRPMGAFITAAVTGLLISSGEKISPTVDESQKNPLPLDFGCCSEGCGCSAKNEANSKSLKNKMKEGLRFAFIELTDDISLWFLSGVLAAGLISIFLKPEIIETYIGSGLSEMIVMLGLSIPLYVCATASTPIAAALMAKGISPGAALVFLLAGPATNAATVIVTSKILGKKNTVIYVLSISVCAIMLGYATDLFYSLGISKNILTAITQTENQAHGLVDYFSALILGCLIISALIRKLMKNQRFSFQ